MGSWDCYCALCAGPLGGSHADVVQALAKWRRSVVSQMRKLQGEDDVPEVSSKRRKQEDEQQFTDTNSDYGDDNNDKWGDDDSAEQPETSTKTSPKIDPLTCPRLPEDEMKWLDHGRVLAINCELGEKGEAFISGRGRYQDYGGFEIKRPGNDPKDPGKTEYTVYYDYSGNEEELTALPFHEACFKILTRCLGYGSNKKKVNKDILYTVMQQHIDRRPTMLDLDYGDFVTKHQFWTCERGYEWAVIDPGSRPGIEEVVKCMMPAKLFDHRFSRLPDLGRKVRNDPFTKLPYDILHKLCAHLLLKDTLSLVRASWNVLESTNNPSFWKQMVRMHTTSYFWELNKLLVSTKFPDTFDWKGAFMWLGSLTNPSVAMKSPLAAIANRRRIWNACEQLAPFYHERMNREKYINPSDSIAAPILSAAECFYTATTMFPAPPESHSITTQFIRSWSEIKHRACDLETYWTGENSKLSGISVTFGSTQRVFGSTQGKQGQSLHIKVNDWIQEIMLWIEPIGLINHGVKPEEVIGKEDPNALCGAFINGMEIRLRSGKCKTVMPPLTGKLKRVLTVLPDMHLIGLTGEITSDGLISRFGILQARGPDLPPPTTIPSYSYARRLLWDNNSEWVITHDGLGEPIWSHSDKSLHTFSSFSPPIPSFIHPDMIPYSIMLWAPRLRDFEMLVRISMLQMRDEMGRMQIIGIWHKQNTQHGSASHIGTAGPVPAQIPYQWANAKSWRRWDWQGRKAWEEGYMRHFDIDGPGGEIVTEVHVTSNRRGIKLVTNRGREGTFGHADEGDKWEIKKADAGEWIVGLSASFGQLGGWSPSAKMWSHWALSDLMVVVMKLPENVNKKVNKKVKKSWDFQTGQVVVESGKA